MKPVKRKRANASALSTPAVAAAALRDTEFVKTEIVSTDCSQNPQCSHGPSVLFSRSGRKFFACSAYRSRKLCPFYLELDKWNRDGKKMKLDVGHEKTFDRKLNKGQAQYLFSSKSLEFLTKMLQTFNITDVICIGVPTLHSALCRASVASYLLDIDLQFTTLPKFSQYNMCNHHFFREEDRLKFSQFLEQCAFQEVAIICDPPFGARLELIVRTFREIQKELQEATNCDTLIPKVLLVHPYFSEGKILKIDSTLRMCDYKIEYESHKKFKNETKSPVRIFTNAPLDRISFPASASGVESNSADNQYKYCQICDKHVFRVSVHCKICNRCDSKDGKPCRHCFECGFCVKESWTHCPTCKSCHFPGNRCKITPKSISAIDKIAKQSTNSRAKSKEKRLTRKQRRKSRRADF